MWEYTYLMHHGIKGQKWGIRRYQNEDGTLTKEGRIRYMQDSDDHITKFKSQLEKNKKELADGVYKNDPELASLVRMENKSLEYGIKYEAAMRDFISKHKKTTLSQVQNYSYNWSVNNGINKNDAFYIATKHIPLKWNKITSE